MSLQRIDHFVLIVADIEASCAFYETLGMKRAPFGEGRMAMSFGQQKINFHQATGDPAEPKAKHPGTGTTDFCLIDTDLDAAIARLEAANIEIITGPVARTGANGPIRSVYCYDPDGNLVEISAYEAG
ncbi:UNVERIFIED_CONTAM: hypothetical protein GTU68_030253 [Idotea baltica]|nr:hypothetical protein [Idotea baltica]